MTRILLVDDEDSYTRLFKLVVEDVGDYEVRVVNDPEMALESALEFRPDVVVLDVIMPRMNGLQVAAALREHDQLAALPVIFVTATASRKHPMESDELLRECIVLSKPVSTNEVLESIGRVLSERG